jgi:hypothetical protein
LWKEVLGFEQAMAITVPVVTLPAAMLVSPGASNPATERRFKTSQFGSLLVM